METSSESSTSSNRQVSPSSPSKSNGKPTDPHLSPVAISSALHLSVAGAIALVIALGSQKKEVENIEVRVIENPKPAPPNLDLTPPKEPEPPKPKPEESARKVFGVSRKAITADAAGPGIEVKQGNTVATAPDDLKLKDSDADSLPIPTDEYLVSKMPSLTTRVNVPYPQEAREKNIEGDVVMQILIDEEGRVRDAKLIRGPGSGLNEAALNAIKQYRFSPAEVDGKRVAVSIQYTYNFKLKE